MTVLVSQSCRRIGTALTLTILLAVAPARAADGIKAASGAAVTVAQQAEAQAFWGAFRTATMKADWGVLAGMSAQPLVVRGEVDSVPPTKVTREMAQAVLRTQFSHVLFAGKGKPARTTAAWVEATPELTREHWLSVDQIRVHNLVFRKDRNGWKLATIFEEEQ